VTFGICGILIAGAVLAARNLLLARADRHGARRLAILVFGATLACALLFSHHVSNYNEVMNLVPSLSWASFIAVFLGMTYVATEPFVRRNWPDALVSWSRIINLQFRDHLVASHVLAGIAAAVALFMLRMVIVVVGFEDPIFPSPRSLEGTPHMVGGMIAGALTSTFFFFCFVLALVLIRSAARRNWIGNLVWLLLEGASDLSSPTRALWRLLLGVLLLWLLYRYGMLVIITMAAAMRMMTEAPLLLGSPNFGAAFIANASMALIAAAALFAIARKPVYHADTSTS
jgi:hypothetical protein